MHKGIVVFDLCGTLYRSNTTYDFIEYFHKKKRHFIKWFLVFILMSLVGKIFVILTKFRAKKFHSNELISVLKELAKSTSIA